MVEVTDSCMLAGMEKVRTRVELHDGILQYSSRDCFARYKCGLGRETNVAILIDYSCLVSRRKYPQNHPINLFTERIKF